MIKISNLLRHAGRAPELFTAWRRTPAWLEVTRRYLEIGSPAYPCQIPLPEGGKLDVNSPGELKVFWQIFVHQCYRLPPQCETIVDAGANIGIFAIWAARKRPTSRIVSLEPFPQTFRLLESNIHHNELQGRIRLRNCALAGETGQRMFQSGDESPNNSLVLRGMEDSALNGLAVPCFTLADLLTAERLERIDLLKMDIEGAEWEVLFSTPAAVLRSIRYILLEYHEVNARFGYAPEQLFAHLNSAGHRMTHREENADRTGLAFFQLTNQE